MDVLHVKTQAALMPVVQVCVVCLCRWHGVCYVHQSPHLMTLLPLLLSRLYSKWPPAERSEIRGGFHTHLDTFYIHIKIERKTKSLTHSSDIQEDSHAYATSWPFVAVANQLHPHHYANSPCHAFLWACTHLINAHMLRP